MVTAADEQLEKVERSKIIRKINIHHQF